MTGFTADIMLTNVELIYQNVMRASIEEIQLTCTYPRLDAQVTLFRDHLLKAPFCVHPDTGHICTPLDPKRLDRETPPTLSMKDVLAKANGAFTLVPNGDSVDAQTGLWSCAGMAEGVQVMTLLVEALEQEQHVNS